jgi:4-hydroxy-tetrahydrodipicolinate synthase
MRVGWRGIYTVLVTPMREDGSIDEAKLEKLARNVVANGADGLIACGSTGEFYALSFAERAAVVRRVVESCEGKAPVLAGVSALSVADVLTACEDAAKAGAAGYLMLPPIYASPSEREIEAFYVHVHDRTSLPIMLYNSPRRLNVSLTPTMVKRLADLPRIVAIKDSSALITQVTELVHAVGREIAVFVGYETMINAAHAAGAMGVVAMAHQVAGAIVRGYYDAVTANDTERIGELEPLVYAIYQCFQCGSYYAAIKETLRQTGQDMGPPRLPLLPLAEFQRAAISDILERNPQIAATIAMMK